MHQKTTILGIPFFGGNMNDAIEVTKKGGLMLAPSGPGLAIDLKDPNYRQSLLAADIVIPDSGLMVLLWNIFHGNNFKRLSGLNFFKRFIDLEEIKKTGTSFWIMPSEVEKQENIQWLKNEKGISLQNKDTYLAPMYPKQGKLEDETLLTLIKAHQPQFIIINIGGGIQERLGHYLKENLNGNPTIICTGAAIAFLTNAQVSIPHWVDYVYLGWFFRCLQNPKKFIPRYWKAKRLAYLVIKYGKKSPF